MQAKEKVKIYDVKCVSKISLDLDNSMVKQVALYFDTSAKGLFLNSLLGQKS